MSNTSMEVRVAVDLAVLLLLLVVSCCDADTASSLLHRRLRLIEATSPALKSQRVACLISMERAHGDVLEVEATNSFLRHTGVHAEINGIVSLLNAIVDDPSSLTTTRTTTTATETAVRLVVSFSPCVACAEVIAMLASALGATRVDVDYDAAYDDGGVEKLQEHGIAAAQLQPSPDALQLQASAKQHAYAREAWAPAVTSVRIALGPAGPVLHEQTSAPSGPPFDVRPAVMAAMLQRPSSRARLSVTHVGELNHREKLFLSVCGVAADDVRLSRP